MKLTFRWYGKDSDSIPLEYIKQIPNCTGLMGMLDQIPAGEVWPEEVIADYVADINQHGLEVEVIESVNVHEDIKMGLPSRDGYIENYKQTIKNLAKYGVKVIVYNFMPVFDWLKTNLNYQIGQDEGTTLYYDEQELAGLTPQKMVEQTTSAAGKFVLPGWEPERLKELDRVLAIYKDIDEEKLKENYKYFLEAIIPTAEACGVRMAVHPDDPAWPVFGIPRIAHTKDQFDEILQMVDSPSNALCYCTGSMGSAIENNNPEMIRYFAGKNRIACAHVRNIKHLGDRKFYEAAHPSDYGSLDMYEIMKAFYDTGFDGYIRPDHGRMIWGETGRPGYGLYDRALGLTYLSGLWEAISKAEKE